MGDTAAPLKLFDEAPPNTPPEILPLIHSVSKLLIQDLKNITCKHENCKDEKFSKWNLPVIAYCGHYICKHHEHDSVPFKCGTHECNSLQSERETIDDEVLIDFYNAIGEEGFKCLKCTGSQNVHPRHNVINCPAYRLEYTDPEEATHFCVWCIMNGLNKHWNSKVERVKENAEKIQSVDGLASLDRTQNFAGWALNQCCIMRQNEDRLHMLRHPFTGDNNIAILPCNHLACESCVGSIDDGAVFGCALCTFKGLSQHLKEDNNWRVINSHAREYLPSLVGQECQVKKCKRCEQYHPFTDNIWKDPQSPKADGEEECHWCSIESREINRPNRPDNGGLKLQGNAQPNGCCTFL